MPLDCKFVCCLSAAAAAARAQREMVSNVFARAQESRVYFTHWFGIRAACWKKRHTHYSVVQLQLQRFIFGLYMLYERVRARPRERTLLSCSHTMRTVQRSKRKRWSIQQKKSTHYKSPRSLNVLWPSQNMRKIAHWTFDCLKITNHMAAATASPAPAATVIKSRVYTLNSSKLSKLSRNLIVNDIDKFWLAIFKRSNNSGSF